jgi:hypothetical protein
VRATAPAQQAEEGDVTDLEGAAECSDAFAEIGSTRIVVSAEVLAGGRVQFREHPPQLLEVAHLDFDLDEAP